MSELMQWFSSADFVTQFCILCGMVGTIGIAIRVVTGMDL